MSGTVGIVVFVVAIVAAIMLHELGHFLTARRFGMRADRFFLGFGPTIVSRRVGETEFGIKAVPLGGFVRIVGMGPEDVRQPSVLDAVPTEPIADPVAFVRTLDATLVERGIAGSTRAHISRRVAAALASAGDARNPRAVVREILSTELADTGRIGDAFHRVMHGDDGRFFVDRPAWQRAVVLVSGSLTHFLLAIGLLIGGYVGLPQWTGGFDTRIAAVEPGSPTADAGLRAADRVVAVGDVASSDYETLRAEIRRNPAVELTITVARDGDELELTMVPDRREDPATGTTVGVVGFTPDIATTRLGPIDAIEQALVGSPQPGRPGGFVGMFTGSVRSIGSVFSPAGIGDILAQATGQDDRAADGAVSLVGAASIAGQVSGGGPVGMMMFLGLLAVVNVFIGIFNLLPLPPLDGGHLAALGVERAVNAVRQLRGRPATFAVDPRVVAALAVPVLAVLAVVVVALLWMDVTNPIQLG